MRNRKGTIGVDSLCGVQDVARRNESSVQYLFSWLTYSIGTTVDLPIHIFDKQMESNCILLQ